MLVNGYRLVLSPFLQITFSVGSRVRLFVRFWSRSWQSQWAALFAISEDCSGTGNPNHILPAGNRNTDLQIDGVNCVVDGSALTDGEKGVYVYRNVNIYNGGTLIFEDAPIDFHAHSILVEMKSTLEAGATAPIKGPLTIWLWGTKTDDIASITCKSDGDNQCGIPKEVWTSNPNLPMKSMPMPSVPCKKASAFDYKLAVDDCFYQYDVLEPGDIAGAYFGRKVLAVSAGGNVILRGAKGIRPRVIEAAPADSGTSWAHLVKTLNGNKETRVYIDRAVPTWSEGDKGQRQRSAIPHIRAIAAARRPARGAVPTKQIAQHS